MKSKNLIDLTFLASMTKLVFFLCSLSNFASSCLSQAIENEEFLKLPFHLNLEFAEDSSLSMIVNFNSVDCLPHQFNKGDSTENWILVGLKVFGSHYNPSLKQEKEYMSEKFYISQLKSSLSFSQIMRAFQIPQDKIKPPLIRQYGQSFDWVPYQCKNDMIIRKCDGYIGSTWSSETWYEYYFRRL